MKGIQRIFKELLKSLLSLSSVVKSFLEQPAGGTAPFGTNKYFCSKAGWARR
jgi:hypothetical protein